MQIPSGTRSPRSAHTRRLDRLPSAPMSSAVSPLSWDSATINVTLSSPLIVGQAARAKAFIEVGVPKIDAVRAAA
jgi:hypothetical protein